MVITSTAQDFIQWLMLQKTELYFGRRFIDFEVMDDRTVRVVSRRLADRKVVREDLITLALVPLGGKLEVGWVGGVGEWCEVSDKFLDRLGDRIRHTWPDAYNDFECYSPPDNNVSPGKAMTDTLLICDEPVRATADNLIEMLKRRLQGRGMRVTPSPDRFHLALFTKRDPDADLPPEERRLQTAFARVAIEPIDERCRLWVALDYAPDDLLEYPAREALTETCAAVIAVCNGKAAAEQWRMGVDWQRELEEADRARKALEQANDCDRFELIFLDTPSRLAREVRLFDADRSIYRVDDRDTDTAISDLAKAWGSNAGRDTGARRIAPDADFVTVSFWAEHITGTFGASAGFITARAMRDGTSRLTLAIGRNPGTQKRWSDLREELERLGLLTLPTEARADLPHHESFIVRDAEDRRVAIALAKAWQTRWVKLLSDTDTLVTRPAVVIEPRGPLMNYVVRVRGHMVRHDGGQARETDVFDVLWCDVIQGGNNCKVQIDYLGEANEWRLHAIDELNEIFYTDATGTRHKGSIHDLPAERAALIIGDELRALDHNWFSYTTTTEPGGRWVWTVYYGPVNDRPRIGEITAGPGRGVGFASAAMERALQHDPDLKRLTPRARDEISKFGRLVTRINDAGAFEADTVLPAIAARSVSTATQPDADASTTPAELSAIDWNTLPGTVTLNIKGDPVAPKKGEPKDNFMKYCAICQERGIDYAGVLKDSRYGTLESLRTAIGNWKTANGLPKQQRGRKPDD